MIHDAISTSFGSNVYTLTGYNSMAHEQAEDKVIPMLP